MAQSIEQLGFELTAGALAAQERALAGLRTRAATVLATASIAGSLLGAEAGRSALSACGALGLASFVLSLGSAVWVLMAHELLVGFDGQTLLAESDRGETTEISDAYRAVSAWIEHRLAFNRDKIARLSGWLTVSSLLLTAEIMLWTISLIG
ncbi:MAG: hypothetical protein WA484_09290 [Solirubrobacteraceae bacterium]